jgi:hypothetical protein
MSYAERHAVALTTDGDGAATGYTPIITGKLSQIRYVKTDFADGVTFAITSEATGETLWSQAAVNASATVAPRQATHTTAGAAALYAGSGVAVLDKIALAQDRVKIVVSLGGAVTSGVIHVVIE